MIQAALPSLRALDLKIMQMLFAGSLGANLFPCVCGEGSGDEVFIASDLSTFSLNGHVVRPYAAKTIRWPLCSPVQSAGQLRTSHWTTVAWSRKERGRLA